MSAVKKEITCLFLHIAHFIHNLDSVLETNN